MAIPSNCEDLGFNHFPTWDPDLDIVICRDCDMRWFPIEREED